MTWKYFKGENPPSPKRLETPPECPPWRSFYPRESVDKSEDEEYWKKLDKLAAKNARSIQRGQSFRLSKNKESLQIIDAVNAAIHLRRPLLVTGAPGSGKTSLAYAVAYELQLGPVLTWPITAKSNLVDAQYQYDAIARLQDAQLDKTRLRPKDSGDSENSDDDLQEEGSLGDYIQLGPVGTAFIPSLRPRVLLIDEIDKSDLNLPNDLLNLFEEGELEIPELVRRKRISGEKVQQGPPVMVRTDDKNMEIPVIDGRIQCCEFPLVIMTSNGERDFPPAFYRRCLRVKMPNPTRESLLPIVKSHFDTLDQNNWLEKEENLTKLLNDFLDKENQKNKVDRSTDQLLNAIYMMTRQESLSEEEQKRLTLLLFKRLSEAD